ncbi:MAG TPA: putative DNA binding domain-containing protein [Prolixibacteraceae bacterium]|nr:putative DNA binding domain-containing protein [Prolixibacteraceae bacterium]
MNRFELEELIKKGETSTVQFKENVHNEQSVAQEMVAFSNCRGGIIIIGVDDKTWNVVGLSDNDLRRLANLLANAASEHVKNPVFIETDTVLIDGKYVMVVTVPEGIDKPYKDKDGIIFMKNGANKRKVTNNEEIMRLLSKGKNLFPDEFPVPQATISDINKDRFDSFFLQEFKVEYDKLGLSYEEALKAKRVLKDGNILLGGLLFFGKQPQLYRPAFCIKSVAFYGNDLGGDAYRDSRDLTGPIPVLYDEGMAFFKRNLFHTQQGQGFNSQGKLEISEIALQELLENALIHREYIKNAPIRLLIFDNRVEIISPGCLPNTLTVEEMKYGNPIIRNNLMVSYALHTMPFRGLGSGIRRALEQQPNIEFINDIEGEQFRVIIPRPPRD